MLKAGYAHNVGSSKRLKDVNLVLVQATYTASGNVYAIDSANSDADCSFAGSTGQLTVTIPAGEKGQVLSFSLQIAEAITGNFIDLESYNPLTGVAVFEVSQTKGTAANPTGDCRFNFAFIVGAA